MSQLLNSQFWQEQEARANEIRPILEQTFALAEQYGWLKPTDDGCWKYQGEAHTLAYNPDSDELWIESNDADWRLSYHEQAFVHQSNALITDFQLHEFRELQAFLQSQDISLDVDLRLIQAQAHHRWMQSCDVTETDRTKVEEAVNHFFSFYRLQAEPMYPTMLSQNSYQFIVDGKTYLLGQDSPHDYKLQEGNRTIDLKTGEGMNQDDVRIWADLNQWVIRQQACPIDAEGESIWARQVSRANIILAIGHQFFEFEERHNRLLFDGETYWTQVIAGDIQMGYTPCTDTFWVKSNDVPIATASDYNHHFLKQENCWQLEGVSNLEGITAQHVKRFWAVAAWFDVREPLFSVPYIGMMTTRRSQAVGKNKELPSVELEDETEQQ